MKNIKRFIAVSVTATILFATALVFSVSRHKKNLQPTQIITTTTSTIKTEKSLVPEIAVNEYWNVKNFPNRHVYVNNTDKGVIYILDDAGKKLGEFWAKNYGFPGGFEIRFFEDAEGPVIFISNYFNKKTRLLAFDPIAVKFLWQKDYIGYLDLPQVQQLDKYNLLFENYGADSVNHLSRINIRTGKNIWELNDPNNFGIYYSKLNNPNELLVRSGGIGSGRWHFTYILDTVAGKFTSEFAAIDDQELAGATANKTMKLLWYPPEKVINLINTDSHEILWSAHPGDEFYDTALSGGPGKMAFYIYKNVILSERVENKTIVIRVFDINTHKLLWKTTTSTGPQGDYVYAPFHEYKNILIGFDINVTTTDISWFHMAYDEQTGQILWKEPCEKNNLCYEPDIANGTLMITRGDSTSTIDLLTGK